MAFLSASWISSRGTCSCLKFVSIQIQLISSSYFLSFDYSWVCVRLHYNTSTSWQGNITPICSWACWSQSSRTPPWPAVYLCLVCRQSIRSRPLKVRACTIRSLHPLCRKLLFRQIQRDALSCTTCVRWDTVRAVRPVLVLRDWCWSLWRTWQTPCGHSSWDDVHQESSLRRPCQYSCQHWRCVYSCVRWVVSTWRASQRRVIYRRCTWHPR